MLGVAKRLSLQSSSRLLDILTVICNSIFNVQQSGRSHRHLEDRALAADVPFMTSGVTSRGLSMASTEPTSAFFSDCYSLMLLAATPAASPDDSTNDFKFLFVLLKYNHKRIRIYTKTKADVKKHYTHLNLHTHKYVCLYGCLGIYNFVYGYWSQTHLLASLCVHMYISVSIYIFAWMHTDTHV